MNIYYIDISGGSKKEASDDLKKQGAYKPNDKNFEENLNIKEINSLPSIFTKAVKTNIVFGLIIV